MSASTNVTSKAAVFVAVAALALTAPLAAADDPLRGLTSSPVEQTGTDSDPCVRHQSNGQVQVSPKDCVATQFHVDSFEGGPTGAPSFRACIAVRAPILGFSMHECFGAVLA